MKLSEYIDKHYPLGTLNSRPFSETDQREIILDCGGDLNEEASEDIFAARHGDAIIARHLWGTPSTFGANIRLI